MEDQQYTSDDGMGSEQTRDSYQAPGAAKQPSWWENRSAAKPYWQQAHPAAPTPMQASPYQYGPQMSLPERMAMQRRKQMEQMMAQSQLGFGSPA